MRIIALTYKIEYDEGVGLEYPPVLVDNSVDTILMTEEECVRIISPIIERLTPKIPSGIMVKLCCNVRDEALNAKDPNRHIAEFWQKAEKRFLL